MTLSNSVKPAWDKFVMLKKHRATSFRRSTRNSGHKKRKEKHIVGLYRSCLILFSLFFAFRIQHAIEILLIQTLHRLYKLVLSCHGHWTRLSECATACENSDVTTNVTDNETTSNSNKISLSDSSARRLAPSSSGFIWPASFMLSVGYTSTPNVSMQDATKHVQ